MKLEFELGPVLALVLVPVPVLVPELEQKVGHAVFAGRMVRVLDLRPEAEVAHCLVQNHSTWGNTGQDQGHCHCHGSFQALVAAWAGLHQ